jgi:hypothetical protein
MSLIASENGKGKPAKNMRPFRTEEMERLTHDQIAYCSENASGMTTLI